MFGQPSPPGHDLPSFDSHMAMIAYVRSLPEGRSLLVSNEGLCGFHEVFARAMAQDLRELDVQVLFWMRPYGEWAVSSYAFDSLIGAQSRDFCGYLEALEPKVSVLPMLSIWAEPLGWDRLRIRSLHPADLVGGDLATDGMSALDLAPPPTTIRQNVTPGWIVTELVRCVLAGEAPDIPPAARLPLADILSTAETVDYYVRLASDRHGRELQRGAYLSPALAQRLGDLYDRDLDLLWKRTGLRLQPDPRSDPTSDMTPSPEAIPTDLLQQVVDLARTFASSPEAARVLASPGLRRLLSRTSA